MAVPKKTIKKDKAKKVAVKRPTLAPPNKVIKIGKSKKLTLKKDKFKGRIRTFEVEGDVAEITPVLDIEQTLTIDKADFAKPNGVIEPPKVTLWQQLKYYFGQLKP